MGYVGYGEVRRFIAVVLSAVGVGGGSAASPLAGLPAAGQAPVAPRPASALAPAPLPPLTDKRSPPPPQPSPQVQAPPFPAPPTSTATPSPRQSGGTRLGAAAAAIPTDAVTPLPSHPPPPPPTPALSTASPSLVRATIATASADAAAAAAAAAATTAAPASYPASYGDDGAVVARGVVGSVAASTVPRDEADVALRCLRAELRDLEESSAASSAAAVAAAAVAAMEARASTSPHQSPSAAITPPPPPPQPQQPSPQHVAAAAAAGGGAADLALQLQIAHHEVHLLKEHLHAAHRRSEALQLRLEEREGECSVVGILEELAATLLKERGATRRRSSSRPRSSRRTSCRPPSAWSAVRARVGTSRAPALSHPTPPRQPRAPPPESSEVGQRGLTRESLRGRVAYPPSPILPCVGTCHSIQVCRPLSCVSCAACDGVSSARLVFGFGVRVGSGSGCRAVCRYVPADARRPGRRGT